MAPSARAPCAPLSRRGVGRSAHTTWWRSGARPWRPVHNLMTFWAAGGCRPWPGQTTPGGHQSQRGLVAEGGRWHV